MNTDPAVLRALSDVHTTFRYDDNGLAACFDQIIKALGYLHPLDTVTTIYKVLDDEKQLRTDLPF